jgi:type VI secretion system secreted protein Hcp
MALDFYVQINGIDGQSNDKGHSKWIEAIAFSHGSKQQIASERATAVAGRGTFEPFVFVHEIDKATPKLQQFCMSGQKIDKVKVEVCSAVAGVQTPVYEVTLEQVKVISAKVQAGQAGFSREDIAFKLPGTPDAPSLVEVVELAAGKITWKSVAIKPDGSKDGAVEANFNQIENA